MAAVGHNNEFGNKRIGRAGRKFVLFSIRCSAARIKQTFRELSPCPASGNALGWGRHRPAGKRAAFRPFSYLSPTLKSSPGTQICAVTPWQISAFVLFLSQFDLGEHDCSHRVPDPVTEDRDVALRPTSSFRAQQAQDRMCKSGKAPQAVTGEDQRALCGLTPAATSRTGDGQYPVESREGRQTHPSCTYQNASLSFVLPSTTP